jgi:hypothetical protein
VCDANALGGMLCLSEAPFNRGAFLDNRQTYEIPSFVFLFSSKAVRLGSPFKVRSHNDFGLAVSH